ncbi:MAG: carbohydrate ABC transporter permease [Roseburia sp.]|nr:carbohydrate ABC transporter permease [Roseburia sp.]
MKKINVDKVFGAVNIALLLLIAFIMLYPLYFVIIASFSDPYETVLGNVTFWIKGFTLTCYKQIFKYDEIWIGYRNSIIYTFLGTIFNLVLTIPAAYGLSKKKLMFRKGINTYFLIPMIFSGGLLPTFLQIKKMGLYNEPYTMILLGGVSIYNMIITRTYFTNSIPESLYEAADIDGCSDIKQFIKIALPLAKPIIAVIALYYAVGRWNAYFNAMIYLNNKEYYPLQLVLKNILINSQIKISDLDVTGMDTDELLYITQLQYVAQSMKYGIVFVASVPMLIIYPFVQKYFVKGVMVGSIKG